MAEPEHGNSDVWGRVSQNLLGEPVQKVRIYAATVACFVLMVSCTTGEQDGLCFKSLSCRCFF